MFQILILLLLTALDRPVGKLHVQESGSPISAGKDPPQNMCECVHHADPMRWAVQKSYFPATQELNDMARGVRFHTSFGRNRFRHFVWDVLLHNAAFFIDFYSDRERPFRTAKNAVNWSCFARCFMFHFSDHCFCSFTSFRTNSLENSKSFSGFSLQKF